MGSTSCVVVLLHYYIWCVKMPKVLLATDRLGRKLRLNSSAANSTRQVHFYMNVQVEE